MATIDKQLQCPDPDKQNKFEVDLVDRLIRYTAKLGNIINKGVRAADNWDAQTISVTLATANTEQAVAHTLKRIPVGYIVLSMDKVATIYDGTTAWTTTNVYIRSNVNATAVKIILI